MKLSAPEMSMRTLDIVPSSLPNELRAAFEQLQATGWQYYFIVSDRTTGEQSIVACPHLIASEATEAA